MPVTPDDITALLNNLTNELLESYRNEANADSGVVSTIDSDDVSGTHPIGIHRDSTTANTNISTTGASLFKPLGDVSHDANASDDHHFFQTQHSQVQSNHAPSQYPSLDVESKFNMTYGEDMSWEGIVGFEIAADIWSRFLNDDVKINLHIQTSDDLPEQVVGGALPGILPEQKIKDLEYYLEKDKTSNDDETAIHQLPQDRDKLRVVADRYQLKDAKELDFTTANAKALDIINGEDDGLDGLIVMNQDFKWNYEKTPTGDSIDFVSVALHEIGHILGFVSGVDDPGWLTALDEAREKAKNPGDLKGKDPEKDKKYEDLGRKNEYVAFPLDFFRYSDDSTYWNKDYIDLSIGGSNVFFSIDGQAKLADLSTGKLDNGYGYQASHWEQGSNIGIMDPVITLGERKYISPLDLTALDVVGWDVDKTDASQPGWDFDHLLQQAHIRLAERLSVQPDWLVANVDKVLPQLRSDRLLDIEEMLYEGRRRNSRRSTTNWQEVMELFTQEAYFSELSGTEWDAYVTTFSKTVYGTEVGETLTGGRAQDSVFGRQGEDGIAGRRGDDQLQGNHGNDSVMGGGGDDQVSGNQGNDVLDGGRGRDRVRGGDGDDILVGNRGRDWLEGGSGDDVFVLQPNHGADIVRDFVVGEDSIGLARDHNVAEQIAELTVLAEGGEVMIQQDNHLVMTLQRLNPQDQAIILNDPKRIFTPVDLPSSEAMSLQ